jgi:NAD(P)H-flavin reductase
MFIAGGAGITPFIAILKNLERENKLGHNKLLFANKSKEDIIDENRFNQLLGERFVNILSNDQRLGYVHGFITPDLIKQHSDNQNQFYYLCGATHDGCCIGAPYFIGY